MTVSVEFVGVAVYAPATGGLDVFYPDANPRLDPGDEPVHHDGTPAKRHYRWLAAWTGEGALVPLLHLAPGTALHLGGAPGGDLTASQDYLDLVDLARIAPNIAFNPNQAAAVARLRGGSLSGARTGNSTWRFNGNLGGAPIGPTDVTWRLIWDSGLAALDVAVDPPEGGLVYRLEDAGGGAALCIGNFDMMLPDEHAFDPSRHQPGAPVTDCDFKWVYHLLDPGQLHERLRLPDGTLKTLPAPTGHWPARELLFAFPVGGDCVGARIGP